MKKTKLSQNEYRRKLEHQIYLAQEHPAKIYDLTDCNINLIPRGVFTYCKVLRKYSLNLSENNLSSLESGGNLDDLGYLGALILSRNVFKSLPSDILKLSNLKKLIIDYNKLQKFPVILTKLPNLKILNLEGNLIKSVPDEVKNFQMLENLNLLANPIIHIAPELCEIDSMQTIKINLENVKNISKDIILSGFDAVWKHLCKIQDKPFREININFPGSHERDSLNQSEATNYDLTYTKIGEDIEREILEHEQNVSRFINEDRRKSLDQIKKNIQLENDMISAILSQKKDDNDRLLDAIKYEEINTNELICKIFEYNNKAKMREELRNKLPERNLSYEEIGCSLTRESKDEILNSMKQLFLSNSGYSRNHSSSLNNSSENNFSKDRSPFSNNQYTFEKDNEQRLAFKQLQFEKDSQLSRLRDGIAIIEKKLQQLSVEDMIVGSLSHDYNLTNRAHLVNLLHELQKEKETREKILYEKIDQIESTRVNDQKDFWIVQYQNLLDDKAKSAYEVQELLKMADMENWFPVFVKFGYTIDMILDLTMEDLDQLEIRPHSVKSKFLDFLNEWKFNPVKQSQTDSKPSAPSVIYCFTDKEQLPLASPSAPPLNITTGESSCQDNSFVMARKEAECCICLSVEARMLFLNCGHVCCCKQCSFTVKHCPLCRQVILQRVNLEFSI